MRRLSLFLLLGLLLSACGNSGSSSQSNTKSSGSPAVSATLPPAFMPPTPAPAQPTKPPIAAPARPTGHANARGTAIPTSSAAQPKGTTQAQASQTPQEGNVAKQWSSPPKMEIDPNKQYTATIHTTKGDIVAELYPKDAPQAVNNFVFLAKQGFYNGIIFHRVVPGFMIQTGDPTGTGTGGPGYTIPDEPVKRRYELGTLAMARTQAPNSAGSQFFIVDGPQGTRLPPDYVIFGKVTQGMDVVHAIANVQTVPGSNEGEGSRPANPPKIETITISAK